MQIIQALWIVGRLFDNMPSHCGNLLTTLAYYLAIVRFWCTTLTFLSESWHECTLQHFSICQLLHHPSDKIVGALQGPPQQALQMLPTNMHNYDSFYVEASFAIRGKTRFVLHTFWWDQSRQVHHQKQLHSILSARSLGVLSILDIWTPGHANLAHMQLGTSTCSNLPHSHLLSHQPSSPSECA